MKPCKGTQTGKQQQGGELDNNNKWPHNSLFTPCSFTLPENLAKLHQTAQNKLPNVALSQVLCEGGSNIVSLIWDTGVPDNTCCHLLFWGTCAEPSCKFNHNTTILTPEAMARVVTLLQLGVTKIANQPNKSS